MIRTIPSNDRYQADFGWLTARWHFSFADYHDPKNVQWGPLRVFNDDVVQPGQGFPMHPHRDMEIITVVLEGALEHADSLGSKGVLRPGEVQVMSAGKGIVHAERNPSPDTPLRLMQIWILPRTRGLEPRWEQREFPNREGKLLAVVAPVNGKDSNGAGGPLRIDQDATIFLSHLAAGETVSHVNGGTRKNYLFVMHGEVDVNGVRVANGDQARIDNEEQLSISAVAESQFLLMDLAG